MICDEEMDSSLAALSAPFYLFLLSFMKRGYSITTLGNKLRARLPEYAVVFNEICANKTLSRDCYAQVGSAIADDEILPLFQRIIYDVDQGRLPQEIKNVIAWAKNLHITGTWICVSGIRDYEDFPWEKVAQMFPREANKLIVAGEAIESDPYIGFKKSRKGVSQRLYPNIAFICFRLHLELGDQPSLRQYKGCIETPSKHSELIMRMIQEYVAKRASSGKGKGPQCQSPLRQESVRAAQFISQF